MSSLFQKALLYLGLVDEDALDEEQQIPEGRQPNPTVQSSIRTVASQPGEAAQVRGRRVEPPIEGYRPGPVTQVVPSGTEVQTEVITAVGFDDAKRVADRIRARQPVVINLRETDPDMVRRIIDFASGLTYGLDGTMRKIAEGVILILPARVSLGREERRRLAGLGLYAIDEA